MGPRSLGRSRRFLTAALAFIAVLALAGCDAATPEPAATPAVARAEANGFILETTVPRLRWSSADAIQITTTLTWTGPAASATIWTSSGGPVTVGFAQVGGPLSMAAAMTSDCAPTRFPRGVTTIPLEKSGGWSGDDPNAAFYRQFFADPLLHLPAGQWRVIVRAEGFLAECASDAPQLELTLSDILLDVR